MGESKVADVSVGRMLLCNEKPGGTVKWECAKKVEETVLPAMKGLSTQQKNLWRQMVYLPALFQVRHHCGASLDLNPKCLPHSSCVQKETRYNRCVIDVMSGTTTFSSIIDSNREYRWSGYLVDGAKLVKSLDLKSVKKMHGDSKKDYPSNPSERSSGAKDKRVLPQEFGL